MKFKLFDEHTTIFLPSFVITLIVSEKNNCNSQVKCMNSIYVYLNITIALTINHFL